VHPPQIMQLYNLSHSPRRNDSLRPGLSGRAASREQRVSPPEFCVRGSSTIPLVVGGIGIAFFEVGEKAVDLARSLSVYLRMAPFEP